MTASIQLTGTPSVSNNWPFSYRLVGFQGNPTDLIRVGVHATPPTVNSDLANPQSFFFDTWTTWSSSKAPGAYAEQGSAVATGRGSDSIGDLLWIAKVGNSTGSTALEVVGGPYPIGA